MERLNLNKLYYFFVVATEGSVKAASEKLHLTQPTISGQIRQLEEDMGFRVFKRSHRKIELNDRGRILYKKSEKLFALADDIQTSVKQDIGRPERLNLRIGAVQAMSNSFIYDFSLRLWKNDLISLTVRQGSMKGLMRALNKDMLDILLTDAPPPSSKRYRVTNLGSDSLVAVAGKGFDISGKFPEGLNGKPYVAFSNDGHIQNEIDFYFESNGVHPDRIGEVDDVTLMRVITQNSKSFSIMPQRAVKEALKLGELKKLSNVPELKFTKYAITSNYGPKQKIIRQLIKDFFIRKG